MTTTSENTNELWKILIPILLLVIGFGFGYYTDKRYLLDEITRKTDTLVIVKRDTLRIDSARVAVRYVRFPVAIRDTINRTDTVRYVDSVFTTKSFVATIDTVLRRDTISATYYFPQHRFSLMLRRAPDSVRVQYLTIPQIQRVNDDISVFEKILYSAGGFVAGFLIGNLKN